MKNMAYRCHKEYVIRRVNGGKGFFIFLSLGTLSARKEVIRYRLDTISGQDPRAERLRQELRLASYLISKLKLVWRDAISSAKKAVYERRFFVLHETHPPAMAAVFRGLFVGAFQTA